MSERTSRNVLVTAAGSELGIETIKQLLLSGYNVSGISSNQKEAVRVQQAGATSTILNGLNIEEVKRVVNTVKPDVVLNLWPATPNTLLHDGQDWRNQDKFLISSTNTIIEALKETPDIFLVHTSYAFLYGNNLAATENDFITAPAKDPIFAAAINAERMIAAANIPVCLLRMGYMYGPQSHDLKAYIQSFKLFRPYYSGPQGKLQSFLHYEDAARALVLVTEKKQKGIFNVADQGPASFGDFIDYFAISSGFYRPLHIPVWASVFAQIIIAPQQMELLDQATVVKSDKFIEQLGWKPQYPNYKIGIKQVLQSWQTAKNN